MDSTCILLYLNKSMCGLQVSLVNESKDCSLYIAKEKFLHGGYAFPLQNGSAYLEIFNSEYVSLYNIIKI